MVKCRHNDITHRTTIAAAEHDSDLKPYLSWRPSLDKIDHSLTALRYITALAFPFIYLSNSPSWYKAFCIITANQRMQLLDL